MPIKTYYALTKPGIVYGNTLTVVAGFLCGAAWHVRLVLFVATVAGMMLVIASACVINNFTDRGIDRAMARTRGRALARGEIPASRALTFAAVLGAGGFALLANFTNRLTVCVALAGIADYVLLYGIAKRRSVHGTVVGSISGAAPVVAGYVAAAGKFDATALFLFLLLAAWQMPHFYAIAIYRLDDYRAAGLPVLPAVRGVNMAKVQIVLYAAGFVAAGLGFAIFGGANRLSAGGIIALGVAWFGLGLRGLRSRSAGADAALWARRMFLFSLIVMLGLCVSVSLATVSP